MKYECKRGILPFFQLFERFIRESRTGKRLQPNGKKISAGTIQNYSNTLRLLNEFACVKNFELRIRQVYKLNLRELRSEALYWRRFYREFTDYLYSDRGCFDNYVGSVIKVIKIYFNYLKKELHTGVGDFHKSFYIRKEDVPIYPLMPEELSFLIFNKNFEASLSPKLCRARDVFVFGCTVALRISDLLSLRISNLRQVSGQYYLAVRSKKTATDSLILLPAFAVEIFKKYSMKKHRKRVFSFYSKNSLNKDIKLLLDEAGFNNPVIKSRERRGEAIELMPAHHRGIKNYRFCDVASSHTMRRTAITTMLSLGVSEQVVRKISGHSPGSKEFYRYVHLSQSYLDREIEIAFGKLQQNSQVFNFKS